MPEYREAPAGEPLIWATKRAVFAIDPESGALRWRAETSVLRRIFRLGDRLFVLTIEGVVCLQMRDGRSLGVVPLSFVPTAGIASGNRLFVAGPGGAAALTDTGAVLWSAKQEFAEGFSLQQFYECTSHDGRRLWREQSSGAGRYDNPGLLYEQEVAQPDLDSQ